MDGGHLQKMAKSIRDPPAKLTDEFAFREKLRRKAEARGQVEVVEKKLKAMSPPKLALKHKSKVRPSSIPWKLLDELDKEKTLLEHDQKKHQSLFRKAGTPYRRHGT
jgi:hypothetical protein